MLKRQKEPARILGYAETHHILPKCMGGQDNNDNLVSLSAREHFIAHWLLSKCTVGNAKYKMLEAFSIFSHNANRKLRMTSRRISALREANAAASSERNRGNEHWKRRPAHTDEQRENLSKISKNSRWVNNGVNESFTREHEYLRNQGWVYGRLEFSSECLEKMRVNAQNQVVTEQKREKCRQANIGKPKNKESIAKGNETRKRNLSKRVKCEHCSVTTNPTSYKIYHGEHCKRAPVMSQQRTDMDKRKIEAARSQHARGIIYTCPHCPIETTNPGCIGRFHGDKCKHKSAESKNEIDPLAL